MSYSLFHDWKHPIKPFGLGNALKLWKDKGLSYQMNYLQWYFRAAPGGAWVFQTCREESAVQCGGGNNGGGMRVHQI